MGVNDVLKDALGPEEFINKPGQSLDASMARMFRLGELISRLQVIVDLIGPYLKDIGEITEEIKDIFREANDTIPPK